MNSSQRVSARSDSKSSGLTGQLDDRTPVRDSKASQPRVRPDDGASGPSGAGVFKMIGLGALVLSSPGSAAAARVAMIGPHFEGGQWDSDRVEEAYRRADADVEILKVSKYPAGVGSGSGYVYPRNLAAEGPKGGMLMSKFEALAESQPQLEAPAKNLRKAMRLKGLPVRSIDITVNWANVMYEPRLGLLMIAQDGRHNSGCDEGLHPMIGCQVEADRLVEEFGTPPHVLKFEKAKILANYGPDMDDACYDLDMFFHLTHSKSGKPVALLYPPCIQKKPSYAGARAAGVLGRKKVIAGLKARGIDVILLSEADFLAKAGNAVTAKDGALIFSGPISDGLKKELLDRGIRAVDSIAFGRPEFGLHCMTLELPETPPSAPRRKKPEREEAIRVDPPPTKPGQEQRRKDEI